MEWCKAKCRADRWEEEVVLLDEEMRRVLEYCSWKADWWMQQAHGGRQVESPVLKEGMKAYAAEQAHQENRMAETFASKWRSVQENARFIIDRVLGITDVTAPLPSHVHAFADLISIDVDVDQDDQEFEVTTSDYEE